jgi:hypothetical protein
MILRLALAHKAVSANSSHYDLTTPQSTTDRQTGRPNDGDASTEGEGVHL